MNGTMQMFRNDIKQIYNHLDDELSKEVYENRVLYSFTGDDKFISRITKMTPAIKATQVLFNSYILDQSKGKSIIAYGAGRRSPQLIEMLDGIEIVAFCDSSVEKQKNTHFGYNVISPQELSEKYLDSYIIITILSDALALEIVDSLLAKGFIKNQIFVLNEFFVSSPLVPYFDPDIIQPLLSDNEVFIDAGCYICDSTIQFIKCCNSKYDRIIAFEPDHTQYQICLENSKGINNIEIHPFGLWNENKKLAFDIDLGDPRGSKILEGSTHNKHTTKVVKLDDILDGEKATFIKMDIEGAELNALKGAAYTIQKYRPKLAICVYHKPEDIWEIPAYILSLIVDYRLFVRHYGFLSSETVLYAI